MALRGDLAAAEAIYLELSKQMPGSKNIHQRLGRFYLDNGDRAKGFKVLEEHGLLLRLKKLKSPCRLDGELDEACWKDATTIDTFYQCLRHFAAREIGGKSEIRLGYTDEALYIAYRAYEQDTKKLRGNVKTRDQDVYNDDCTEIFIDGDLDHKMFHQVIVNSLGTIMDGAPDTENPKQTNHVPNFKWNGDIKTAPKIEPTQWTVEIEIPLKAIKDSPEIKPGTAWGFNITTSRMGNNSEMGQWVPTYGNALEPNRFGLLVFE